MDININRKYILLSKLHIRNEVPAVQYSITTHNDMTWRLFVYRVETPVSSALDCKIVNNVSVIHDLIRRLEKMKIRMSR